MFTFPYYVKAKCFKAFGAFITWLLVQVWQPIYHILSTYLPIIPLTIRCEKICYTFSLIPLRVCKALTIHKSQGMSVSSGIPYESTVIYLLEIGERTNPGSALVTTSRVTDILFLAICDTNRQVIIVILKKMEVVTVITKKSMECYRLKIVSHVRLLKRI